MGSGDLFHDIRISKGITVEHLAERSGFSVGAIRKFDKGETRSPQRKSKEGKKRIDMLSQTLNISVDECLAAIERTWAWAQSNGVKSSSSGELENPKIDGAYNISIQEYRRCEEYFLSIARKNTECDLILFNYLYLDMQDISGADRSVKSHKILSCIRTARDNIIFVLDMIKALFEAMGAGRCSASLEIVSIKDEQLESAQVETVLRDSLTSAPRHRNKRLEKMPIKGNSIYEEIFIEGKSCVFYNDLSDKISNGKLKTTSENAGKLYNSIFMHEIPDMRDDAHQNQWYLAALCVDSKEKMPEDRFDIFRHYANELAYRISIMLFRLQRLEEKRNNI